MAEVHIFSGGFDSAGALYRRLKEGRTNVYVLHVRRDEMPMGRAETMASRNLIVWLARNFSNAPHYHEIKMPELVGKPCSGFIFATTGYLVGEFIVRHPFIDTVVQGDTGSEPDQTEDSKFRKRYREKVCEAVCNGYAPTPTWVYPNFALTKGELYKMMPEDYRALCWSCNYPVEGADGPVPCGSCVKCNEVNSMLETL